MSSARRDLRPAGAALIVALGVFVISCQGVTAVESRTGSAGWAVPSLGANYLAIPEGPGVKVTITGAGGSWTTVSTDAGPALSEQRKGRIADIAVERWEAVCGLDRSRGRCQVTITYSGSGPSRTLPPTSTAEKEVAWRIGWQLLRLPL